MAQCQASIELLKIIFDIVYEIHMFIDWDVILLPACANNSSYVPWNKKVP